MGCFSLKDLINLTGYMHLKMPARKVMINTLAKGSFHECYIIHPKEDKAHITVIQKLPNLVPLSENNLYLYQVRVDYKVFRNKPALFIFNNIVLYGYFY